jgi:hypothetical protein
LSDNRFPPEVTLLAVRWYLRYGLPYCDVKKLLAERGIDVDHFTEHGHKGVDAVRGPHVNHDTRGPIARLTVNADFDALAIANNRPFALANANLLNAATNALRGKALSRTRRSARR